MSSLGQRGSVGQKVPIAGFLDRVGHLGGVGSTDHYAITDTPSVHKYLELCQDTSHGHLLVSLQLLNLTHHLQCAVCAVCSVCAVSNVYYAVCATCSIQHAVCRYTVGLGPGQSPS